MKTLLLLLPFILLGFNLYAQSGALDSFFDPGTGANGIISTSAIQADGKIIIVGHFTSYNGIARNYIARLNADGSLDSSFDPGTGANNTVESVLVQTDGKMIIVGSFTSYNGVERNRVARLNADGSPDTSFDPGKGAEFIVETVCTQSDGKIIIGGWFNSFNGSKRNYIARLNSDGSLDTSFDPGMGANKNVYSISVLPDGKIIIAGAFTGYDGIERTNIARLNPDGSLDVSFNSKAAMGMGSEIRSAIVQPDGKIIIAGNFTCYNGNSRNHIARLNADGGLDASFDSGKGVTGVNSSVRTTELLPDGKIIIAGWFDHYDRIARNYIARLNPDGSPDTSFDPGTGANFFISGISTQSNGQLIITGGFTSFNETTRNRIARLE